MLRIAARKLPLAIKALANRKRDIHFFDRSDVIGREIETFGSFEHFQLFFVERLLAAVRPQAQSCFVDVGANIGTYTLRFAKTFDEVLAFEPNPVTQGVLIANLYAAGLDDGRVQVRSEALSNRTGSTTFYARRASIGKETSNLGNSGLELSYIGSAYREIDVQTLCGDELLPSFARGRFVFCKIDAEGHEVAVFEGMTNFIRASNPVFQVEIGSSDIFDAIYSQLRSNGYVAFGIKAVGPENKYARAILGSPYELKEISSMDKRTYADVFFVPRIYLT